MSSHSTRQRRRSSQSHRRTPRVEWLEGRRLFAFDAHNAFFPCDVNDNLLTAADPTWIPLLKTPPFPAYTSGHSTFSGAAAAVLTQWFGDNVAFASQSDGHVGFRLRPLAADQIVTRFFTSFHAGAEEAGLSRIYGGIHFQFDNSAGLESGRAVGDYIVANLLRPTS